jgi:PAS domain S-box-containing protein
MNNDPKKWKKRKIIRDLVIVCSTTIFIFIILSIFNFHGKFLVLSQDNERWQGDGLFILIIAFLFALIIFSIFLWRELSHEIIQHNRAKEKIGLNEARLESLHNIFQHKSDKLGDFLDHALDEAVHLTGSKIGWFGFYDEENKTLTISNWSREVMKDCEIPEKKMVFSVENAGIWSEGIHLRKPFIVNDYQAFSLGRRGYPEGHSKIYKFLTIPLLLEDRNIAAMAVANKEKDYDETDALQLTLLMDSVLKIVEQKRTEKALHKKEAEAKRLVQENALVAEIGRIISSTLNIGDVYARFVEKVHDIIHFDRIAISNISSRDNTITPAYVAGLDVLERPIGKTVSLTGTYSEKVLQTRKSLLIHGEDLKKTTDKFPQFAPIFQAGIRSIIIIPLISKDEVIGILQIQSTHSNAYSLRDLTLAERVANQIAGAIANAQLFAEQKRAEEELRENEEKLQALMDASPIGISWADLNGNIQYHNQKFHELFGYTIEDIPTISDWRRRAYPDPAYRESVPLLLTVLSEAQKQGREVEPIEVTVTCKDGSTRQVEQMAALTANRVLAIYRDITEHKEAEKALLKSQQMLEKTFASLPEAVFIIDANTVKIIDCNPAASKIFGYSPEEMKGRTTTFLHVDEAALAEFRKHLYPAIKEKGVLFLPNFKMRRKDGTIFYTENSVMPLEDQQGKHIGWLSVVRDITKYRQAEEQLHQSQKMEAIGRLAGGIAHDFNNLLTVIKGYSQLSIFEMKEGNPLKGNIEEIQKASQRASELTQQLLAFSRRQILELKVLDLNTILRDLDKMLHRIIGEDIEMVYLLSENLGKIKTDPGQMEQVILNLAVNARDAMPSGGKLTIETTNVILDESYTHRHVDVKPGPYVMLSVTDTGCGMSQEIKEHLFEPFFTTKKKGMGTGLGLSTLYGIVKQSGGDIRFSSEQGMGTTFKIYLPNVDELPTELKEKERGEELPLGNETILVVEDELSVRDLAARVLERQGYELLVASNGDEALRLIQEQAGKKIDLLLTDMVMPGMSGPELADRLRASHAEARVLYISGYSNNSMVRHGKLEPGIYFLQKPFSPEALARKVREILDDNENKRKELSSGVKIATG